ncbi:MAG: urea transporter [Gemmataceae bacterium]
MRAPVDYLFPPLEPGQVPYWRLVFRGCAQLCFQSNELTGLFFLTAVAIAAPLAAAYMLVAAAIAPAFRLLLGDEWPVLETGLPGLNPSLVALSLPAFFVTSWTDAGMWIVLVVAVISAVLVTRLCLAYLPFPTLAFPFLITFWTLDALAPSIDALKPIVFGPAEHATLQPVRAVLCSLGEALFSPNIVSGLLFLIGVLQSNWRHGALAFFGAVIGTVVASYHRDVVDPAGINLGLYGFNGVLTAVSVFVVCGGKLRLAILGALLATMLMPAIPDYGVKTLSAPFVFITWVMIWLGWIEEKWFAVPATSPTDDSSSDHSGDSTMPSLIQPLVLPSLLEYAKKLSDANGDWKPFRPGVTAHWLYKEEEGGPIAVLLRYEAGARVALHDHPGYEHLYILEGDQFDEDGSYPAGSFVIHPPGTKHSPGSAGGCLALLIYEKAVHFMGKQ